MIIIRKRQRLVRYIFSFLFLLSNFDAYSKQWYQVEFLVFELNMTITDEQWPRIKHLKEVPLTLNMETAFIQPVTNEILVIESEQLNFSQDYRVHYHESWCQSVSNKLLAEAITVQSNNMIINGSIRLYKENYIHAELDLWLIKDIKLTNIWSGTLPENTHISSIRAPNLRESRRIYSNKLYFFDHPKMGALMQLTPINTPVEDPDGEE